MFNTESVFSFILFERIFQNLVVESMNTELIDTGTNCIYILIFQFGFILRMSSKMECMKFLFKAV